MAAAQQTTTERTPVACLGVSCTVSSMIHVDNRRLRDPCRRVETAPTDDDHPIRRRRLYRTPRGCDNSPASAFGHNGRGSGILSDRGLTDRGLTDWRLADVGLRRRRLRVWEVGRESG